MKESEIFINQIGYQLLDSKTVFISAAEKGEIKEFSVCKKSDKAAADEIVFTGELAAAPDDEESGGGYFTGDFSDYTFEIIKGNKTVCLWSIDEFYTAESIIKQAVQGIINQSINTFNNILDYYSTDDLRLTRTVDYNSFEKTLCSLRKYIDKLEKTFEEMKKPDESTQGGKKL